MHRAAHLLLLLGLLGATVRANPLTPDAVPPPLDATPAAPAPLRDFATVWHESADIYADTPVDLDADVLTLLAPPPDKPARAARDIASSEAAAAASSAAAPAATPGATPAAAASPLALHSAVGAAPYGRPPPPAARGPAAPVIPLGADRAPYFVPAVNEALIEAAGGKSNVESLIDRAKTIPKPLAAGLLLFASLGVYAAVRRR